MIDLSWLVRIRPTVAIPGLKIRVTWYPHPTLDMEPLY